VLAVGSLKPHKNLRLAVEAFRIIRPEFPGLKLVIVGRNEGLLTLEKDFAAAFRGLPEGSVVLTGEVTSRELKNYYYHARLFVFPSLYEGFGLPILEAMSFGIPIAASSAGPIREVGGDAVGYFDPKDARDMARCMAEALRRPAGAGLEGYRARLEMFGWDRSAQRHAEIMVALGRAGRKALGR
jgi:glycosyltransferase involved in cell wall biosynthesis